MNKELTVFFENGCNAILFATKHIVNNYNILSFRDIYHDFSICGMNINMNNEAEIILKSYLSPMRVPIFNANQVKIVYNNDCRRRDLHYWIIAPNNNPIESINRDQNFSISLVLMYDQNTILSIVSVPSEDRLYFEYLDKGVFVIDKFSEKQINLRVKSFMSIAKSISVETIVSEKRAEQNDESKHPNTHHWIGAVQKRKFRAVFFCAQ